jgi:hypothetical protein
MRIETKFNINDEVWVIDFYESKPEILKRQISEIETNSYSEEIDIFYKMWFTEVKYNENSVFKSKEELIASL